MATAVANTTAKPHFFGIRHHGPGCARSLLQAFEALQPDCVLVEGPPEGEALLRHVIDEGMQPPVALLTYAPESPRLAVYHPFAVFSPEWQALRWAVAKGVPAQFIDLPLTHELALEKARRDTAHEVAEAAAAAQQALGTAAPDAREPEPRIEKLDAEAKVEDETLPSESLETGDPLAWLARAAGYADGESWWNHMVEERGDGEQLFTAIHEAMLALRADISAARHQDAEDAEREARREAYMRQCIRAAQKQGRQRIAVVCGAWHLGGLSADVSVKADQALLKGLPKIKLQSTWVPWTYRHLSRASGYGAGIAAPGWYEHLWTSASGAQPRAVGWLARVARLMRERELDCSSAHLIEAARLADTLAALRNRPAPGLPELHEATRAVLTLGDDTLLRYIDDALVVGDRFGSVPADVPTVPLQRDIEQAQKALRLKPEALLKTLDLDLRQPNDLARSHLLHRLNLLDLPWGQVARGGRSSKGSFHEVWNLQCQPEFQLRAIEASQWGQTVVQAATARVVERCGQIESLAELSALVDTVLLADLDQAVAAATHALENRAALTGDALQLLAALPSLANVFRYGNVRQTDAAMVAHVLDGLIVRAAISLPLACQSLDEAAAEALRDKLLAADAAIALRQGDEQTSAWRRALAQLVASGSSHALLQGVAVRLLLDAGEWTSEQAAQAMSLQLSSAAEPSKAAAWLEGFLNRNAMVLLHDATVWQLLDSWLAGLNAEHFVRVLPLVRRSFASFGPAERRNLGQRARQGVQLAPAGIAAEPAWHPARAELALPLLRQLLGVPAGDSSADASGAITQKVSA